MKKLVMAVPWLLALIGAWIGFEEGFSSALVVLLVIYAISGAIYELTNEQWELIGFEASSMVMDCMQLVYHSALVALGSASSAAFFFHHPDNFLLSILWVVLSIVVVFITFFVGVNFTEHLKFHLRKK